MSKLKSRNSIYQVNIEIAEKTPLDKLESIKNNPKKLTEYLANYPLQFMRDIDRLWFLHDSDKNNFLDRDEAYTFVSELSACLVEKERA